MKSCAAFIIAHEDFAQSLNSTVEKIMGSQENIYAYSNKTDSLPVLFEKIKKQMESLKDKQIFVFVDLVGGSCWSLANMIVKQFTDITVIGGVNLPMIVSLIINHDKMTKNQLIDKLVEDSRKGIKVLQGNE